VSDLFITSTLQINPKRRRMRAALKRPKRLPKISSSQTVDGNAACAITTISKVEQSVLDARNRNVKRTTKESPNTLDKWRTRSRKLS
jgi:hypothetical protein